MIAIVAGATLGLASWIHCIGMCGPLVSVLHVGGPDGRGRALRSLAYHAGRTLTYIALGLSLGALTDAARLIVVGSIVSVLVGCMLVVMALAQLFGASVHVPKSIADYLRRTTARIRGWSQGSFATSRAMILGAANGLLPCGVSLSAVVAAATLASIQERVIFLLAFGVVTTPALAGLAELASWVSVGIRRRFVRISAAVLLLMGVLVTLRGMSLDIPFVSPNTMQHQHAHGSGSCCTANR